MAVKTKAKAADPARKRPVKSLFDEKSKQDDLAAFLKEVQDNPWLYIGGAVFILVCVLAGVLYTQYNKAANRELYSALSRALDKEEAADQLAALEALARGKRESVAEITYLAAEKAFEARDYDKAKELFERVRTTFADSAYVPDAVEGLGYVAENAGELDAALAYYQEIGAKWPKSFAARRQPLNIGRVEERRGNLAAAVAAYKEQGTLFPGSTLDAEAQAALARLEKTNPELFPTPAAATAGESADALQSIELPALNLPAAPEEGAVGDQAAPMPELNLDLDAVKPDTSGAATPPVANGAPAPAQ
ncbi:MAG: hypothetical protein AMXMBFR4_29410 [Candidatus Hydrogenedentota bacterium]